ncbi:DUF2778 domain-containing protein [Cronobacter muytjensii]|uniref:DUF2778 domain-containing protein n=1 Tax=Cronobacter muytjensii TaxID=413501 RepID=UPI0024A9758A|nr:DUF2778 domain-containing protein [Cronobacter muytjensii]EKS1844218.1 DUF2778 domain-containing protein [Cronobacter muytjensii]ELY4517907.1 DUF2778 domain-containing protein [Cronobacter muytjensii]ELY6223758.1 DUF2778 domain-containing protein [Cronobacter muytjensii]ELY6274890.1 DUF2778 domain-containing protein [Cronobacter muytjensii]MDI6455953.1 DUF2778 domain-containing protein [Cronobacter muytjensii]
MISCELNYNEKTSDGRLILRCAGVGSFPVFSGLGSYKNTVEFAGRRNGPIPLGRYWIVERPRGGPYSRYRTWQKKRDTGNLYNEWFALFRQDGFIDDQTFVDGTFRGSFRLHPLRPDGTGVSDGCVTFYNRSDFYILRRALLKSVRYVVHCSGLKAYGQLNVIGVPYARLS